MKKVFFSFLIFLFISNHLYSEINKPNNNFSGCDNEVSKEYLNNIDNYIIKKIEIDINNYKKWTVNNIRIITSGSRFISDKLKKRFKSTVTVTYENGTKCSLKAKVRQSGDAKDHIALKNNSVIQSLDISLDNGNIKGITKFKLYKPDVRGVLDDVVIQTQLLRNFDYLAPRSYKVKARVNEINSVMLFQEKASKELLEFNKRREGPILEADQKFFFNLVRDIPDNQLSNWSIGKPFFENKTVKTMLSKQTNANIINRGDVHKEISLEALTNLNLIYLYYANRFKDDKNDFFYFDYDLDNALLAFFEPNKETKLHTYNLLMQSTNSHHALSVSNRKFYWNSIENYYEPINYDANPTIDGDFSSTTTVHFRLPVPKNHSASFELLENKLKNLNIVDFYNQVRISGLDLDKKTVQKKINKILENLNKIEIDYLNENKKNLIEHNRFKPMNNILEKFNTALNEIDPNAYLIKNTDNNNSFERCQVYLKNCKEFNFTNEELSTLIEGELKIDDKYYQYLGKNLNLENLKKDKKYNKLKLSKTTIYYEDGVEVDLDIENKKINIYQKTVGARAYLINGELNSYTINFNGLDIIENKDNFDLTVFPKNFPINSSGLTGCLSLINLKLVNVNISANNSNCEDAINFINTNGVVENIFIKNSFSDALDVDFSKLNFNNVEIISARNDCTDFSAGKYILANLKLNNCGDKGLSIGEKSFVKLKKIEVKNANIGIATKDSSILELDNAYLSNLKTCVSAYNKKQEFVGGFIEMSNFSCENYYTKADYDKFSRIFLKKELLKNFDYGNLYNPTSLKISQVKGKNINKNFINDYKTINDDNTFNAVVEIPLGINEKWEVSKINGSLVREFFMGKPRIVNYASYPVNYGMIPRTLLPLSRGGDGDPLDVLILGESLTQGEVIKVKAIGLMKMNDSGDQDDKIIAVPLNKTFYEVNNIEDLKKINIKLLDDIKFWFVHYKGTNVVEFINFESQDAANELIGLTQKYFERSGINPRS